MDEYVRDFVQESEENITALNNALLRLENDPDDDAAMEEIFRTAHTLKGNSGAMGFSDASDLAHALEDLLESVRTDAIEVTPSLMDQVFEGVDLLEAMIDEVRRNGEPQTEPSATIEALRAYGGDGIAEPDDGEVRDLLSSVNRPADGGHHVYHVRLAITESGEVNNGVLVVEALRDAFDLLGTDPAEEVIEDDDYGAAFDAAFASPVGETAISAALEPVDAVEDAIITDATGIASEEAAAAESVDDDATDDEETASPVNPAASADMSVDDLLADDEVDQFDDLDSMVDEVEDMEGLDDLGDAGSFADVDASPDVSTVADAEPADDEPDVDELLDEAEAETDVTADAEPETEAAAEADEEVEDASSTFAELKEEVDPVGFDELQDELDELEFDELDSDDEVGFDELLGDDDSEFGAFDGDDEDIDVEAELGIDDEPETGAEDDLGVGTDLDVSDDGGFGEVAFGDDGDAVDESETSADAGTDASAAEEQSASSAAEEDDPFGDIDFGEGIDGSSESDDAAAADADVSADDFSDDPATADTDASADDHAAADSAAEADSADLRDDAANADALDASTADDSADADAAAGDADDGVESGEFGDLDLDDSDPSFGTSTVATDEFEGFQSPDVEESEAAADATESDLDAVTDKQSSSSPRSTVSHEDDAAESTEAADVEGADEARSAVDQSGPSTESEEIQSVRVDVDKVDTLMNLVEGMVTSRVRLRRAIERGESLTVLDDELDELEDITGELQDTVMDIRLVPLNTVANKLPRIVRDISREQGKQVTFEMHGDDVEIDRSILNEIGDPLVHIVRNAVDHGIESPDEREAADKDSAGTIELRARRERDRVVIEVEDDGRGLDVDSLREEAAEQGVVTEAEAAAMDDDDVYDLIFHSGFSTTEEVTDVSGRGVGMDVVASTVEDLDGDVAVDSSPGEGTTVRLTLPVTVAIADVLFVQSGDEEYGIPIKDVKDIGPVRDVETVDGQEVVVRGDEEEESEFPLVRLGETLDTPGTHRNGDGMLVSIRDDVRPVALHCDDVRGQQEVVVKPYEGVLGDVPGLSGATVLGEGDVVNILDVESL